MRWFVIQKWENNTVRKKADKPINRSALGMKLLFKEAQRITRITGWWIRKASGLISPMYTRRGIEERALLILLLFLENSQTIATDPSKGNVVVVHQSLSSAENASLYKQHPRNSRRQSASDMKTLSPFSCFVTKCIWPRIQPIRKSPSRNRGELYVSPFIIVNPFLLLICLDSL